jgi:hypothetical protein
MQAPMPQANRMSLSKTKIVAHQCSPLSEMCVGCERTGVEHTSLGRRGLGRAVEPEAEVALAQAEAESPSKFRIAMLDK